MSAVSPEDLRASVLFVVEGAPTGAISLSMILGELRVEPSMKTVDVLGAIDQLVVEKKVTSTGDVAHGTRRFHAQAGKV